MSWRCCSGVMPPAVHVFKASLGGDGLGRLESRAGVRDEADPGEDLIRLDHDLIRAVDPLYPRRTIPEWRIDADLPEIRRVRTRVRSDRRNHRRHRHLLSDLIASRTFGNQLIAVKLDAVGDQSNWLCLFDALSTISRPVLPKASSVGRSVAERTSRTRTPLCPWNGRRNHRFGQSTAKKYSPATGQA